MATQLLQLALALLLAVQNNPNVSDAVRAQAVQVSQAAIQQATMPQALGVIVSPEDGTTWTANSEDLKVTWMRVKAGDERWWPSTVRIDLEGYFGKSYAEEIAVSGSIPNSGSYTLASRNFPTGNYKLFLVGGTFAITPPQFITIK